MLNDKLFFLINDIEHIMEMPPEMKCAILLKMNNITEDSFIKMKPKLNLSNPILLKIQNYLRDEWR